MSDFRSSLQRLYQLIPLSRRLGLERMQAACAQFGNPQSAFESVHIAGTNGKGSTAAFVASMGLAAGRRVGMYTSPHLVKFAERIQVNGQPVSDPMLADLIDAIMARAPDLTFFEVATLGAFLAFREAKVDLAVLEVGLGGRLDATNVIPAPRVAAITRVSFDHMDQLGYTLAQIATEKAGIVKPGCAVVHGKLHPDARAVVTERIANVGARLLPLGSPEPIPGAPLGYPRMAMFGTNLAVATTIGRELGFSPQEMSRGIEQTNWPGRNELLHRAGQDVTLLDCAHNPDGAVTLSHVLDPSLLAEIESRRDVVLVFGAMQGKNWRSMLQRLDHVAGHRIFVSPPLARAVPAGDMAAQFKGDVAENVAEALTRARTLVGPQGVVVVTGSCYLVGAARALLLGLDADPPADS